MLFYINDVIIKTCTEKLYWILRNVWFADQNYVLRVKILGRKKDSFFRVFFRVMFKYIFSSFSLLVTAVLSC